MNDDEPVDLEAIDRDIRINELKHRAEELAGGEMIAWEADNSPPEMAEGFWRGVVDYESAPWTTHLRQLEAIGITPPDPAALDDPALAEALWVMIDGLARIRVFLTHTDHLSDRELYELLWSDLLVEEVKDLPVDEDSAWHLDILGSWGDEDTYLHLKYYADDEDRREWHAQSPEDELPDHVDPPHDRDRHLPKR